MRKALLFGLAVFFGALPVFAQDGDMGGTAYYALGSALAIGIAAIGGAIGQGRIGSAAMEGIARNPQAKDAMFTPMIVSLVLVESLVIYAFVIAFFLQGKI
jgi:F-type H+-transporting ATPase subunit c